MTIDVYSGGAYPREPHDTDERLQVKSNAPTGLRRTGIGIERFELQQLLFRQGQPQRGVLEILEGTVILSNTLADGRRQVLEICSDGALLGAPLTPSYSETAAARTVVRVRRYSQREFQASERLQEIAGRQLCRRIAGMHELALLLGRKTATERIASFLLTLANRDGGPAIRHDEPLTARLHLTQADIADHLGLSIETVCRELSRLKRDRLIELTRRGDLTLDKPEVLAALAGMRGAAVGARSGASAAASSLRCI